MDDPKWPFVDINKFGQVFIRNVCDINSDIPSTISASCWCWFSIWWCITDCLTWYSLHHWPVMVNISKTHKYQRIACWHSKPSALSSIRRWFIFDLVQSSWNPYFSSINISFLFSGSACSACSACLVVSRLGRLFLFLLIFFSQLKALTGVQRELEDLLALPLTRLNYYETIFDVSKLSGSLNNRYTFIVADVSFLPCDYRNWLELLLLIPLQKIYWMH